MDTTERLVLDLPAELVARLRSLVASGEFESESQAVEQLLKAAHVDDDDLDESDLEEIRAAVAEGIADVDAGRLIPAEEVYAKLRAQIKAVAEKRLSDRPLLHT